MSNLSNSSNSTHPAQTDQASGDTQSQQPVPSSKYSPEGTQQHSSTNNTPIAHPDGPDASNSSQGNQAVKEAVENLHPRDMANNLDPSRPAPEAATTDAPPYAGYATGKVPDTQTGSSDPSQSNTQGLPADPNDVPGTINPR